MKPVDFVHLGNTCAPGIIINEILNIHKKQLFMLGIYHFNDILQYITDNNYESIYDKEKLLIANVNEVHHKIYKFIFPHDYHTDEHWQISNYELVKNRFDIKIANFKNMLSNNDMCVFITFTHSVDELKINEMLEWLNNNKNNKKFHLIIFTDNEYSFIHNSEKLSIIKLDNTFSSWFTMDMYTKTNVYKEIYDKFIHRLSELKIKNKFHKKFKHTHYGNINKEYIIKDSN